MSLLSGVTEGWTHQDETVGNDGERMIAHNAWGYWAHLAVYRFAVPFIAGGRVLDVGSGTGYGAAYFAIHGASEIIALDSSPDAIAHSRERYKQHRVTYEIADLNLPLPFADRAFDVVFSSNVFEHIGNIDGLTQECARVLKQDGVLIVAVPAVVSPVALLEDIRNHFHVNHLQPSAWVAKLDRFFESVSCYGHTGRGEFASEERMLAEVHRTIHEVVIRETDFDFPPVSLQELEARAWITAIFVCRQQRSNPKPETLAERSPSAWREGEMAARVLREEKEFSSQLRVELAQARERIAALQNQLISIQNSRSWKATAPLRALAVALRGHPR